MNRQAMRKIMDALTEAPLGDVRYHGPMTPDSLKADDIAILNSDKALLKMRRTLEKAPVVINVDAVNWHPTTAAEAEISPKKAKFLNYSGRVLTSKELKKQFGISLEPKPDELNVVFTHNEGTDRRPFSGWLLPHRIYHVIAEIEGYAGSRELLDDFENICNKVTEQAYLPDEQTMEDPSLEPMAAANVLGWWRSARNKTQGNIGEFVCECFAAYMVRGILVFNPIPETISYSTGLRDLRRDKTEYERLFNRPYDPTRPDFKIRSTVHADELFTRWSHRAMVVFDKGIKKALGKIIVL